MVGTSRHERDVFGYLYGGRTSFGILDDKVICVHIYSAEQAGLVEFDEKTRAHSSQHVSLFMGSRRLVSFSGVRDCPSDR